MRKHLVIILALVLLTAFRVSARDFEYTYEGQTLTYTVISEEEKTCVTKSGVLKEFSNGTTGIGPGNKASGNLIIPTEAHDGSSAYSVISIGDCGFSFQEITSVTIPASVTSIGKWAFSACVGLEYVIISESVLSIGDKAFSSCCGLTSVTIPNSVTTIGNEAFSYCGLTSVTIPNSVTTIGDASFARCGALKEITVATGNANYCSENGVLFNKDRTRLIQYPAGKEGQCLIPNTVTAIGDQAFSSCYGLTSVTIPNSVTTIGDEAFYDCGLTSVTIPNSVTFIGNGVFSGCGALKEITIATGNANYCSENGVLFTKDKTRLIQYPAGKEGHYTIANAVNTIGDKAFSGCYRLISVTIPNSVTTIGNEAFRGTGLNSVIIPNSVTYIGDKAFDFCWELKVIYCAVEDPHSISYGRNVFCGGSQSGTLYVPEAAVDVYRVTSPWSLFKNIVGYDFTGIEDVSADIDPAVPCEVYDLNGVRIGHDIEGLAKGIYLIRQGSSVKKIIR